MVDKHFPVRVRPEILELPRYRQGKSASQDAFKLSSNENPYPPLPGVVTSLDAEHSFNRYPRPAYPELNQALAAKFSLELDQVLIGSGSVALLTQLITAFAGNGGKLYLPWRSFEAYPIIAQIAGAELVRVPNLSDHRHDLDGIVEALQNDEETESGANKANRMVLLCSPNNPTGTVISKAEFEEFMAKIPADVLVVLDQAYQEFARQSDTVDGVPYLSNWRNLVVLRTFSKAYGLAGLRIGYALGDAEVLAAIGAVGIPFAVTGLAVRAALKSLELESELAQRVDSIVADRERILAADSMSALQVPKSEANFIWLPLGENSQLAEEFLAERGLVTRNLSDGLRITVGEPESVDSLLTALSELVKKLAD